ncbi:hypothetical protein JW998_10450 [candidate division KSB1 bacterium]|nr:hypothetical protein [candidate division KSB1 bacterium]
MYIGRSCMSTSHPVKLRLYENEFLPNIVKTDRDMQERLKFIRKTSDFAKDKDQLGAASGRNQKTKTAEGAETRREKFQDILSYTFN